jgi:hypothetical protein
VEHIRLGHGRTIELQHGKLYWIRAAWPEVPTGKKVTWTVAEYDERTKDGYTFHPVLHNLFGFAATVQEFNIGAMSEDERMKIVTLMQRQCELAKQEDETWVDLAFIATKE